MKFSFNTISSTLSCKCIKKLKLSCVQNENKLNVTEDLLTNILNSTEDAIAIFSVNENIVCVNNEFIKMWTLPKDFNIQKYDMSKLLYFISQQLKEPDGLKTYINSLLYSNKRISNTFSCKNNKSFKISSTPLIESEKFVGVVCNFKYISHESDISDLISKNIEHYKKLIEFLPAGIYVHIRKKIIFANSAFAKLIGISVPNLLVGRYITDFIHEDYLATVDERINLIYSKGIPCNLLEEKFIKVDGSLIDVEVSASPFICEGDVACLVVVQDITERKQSQVLRDKIQEKQKLIDEATHYNKLQTEFFSNLSHEFKTPLNVLYSSIQLMNLMLKNPNINKSKETLKKMENYVTTMKQNCFRLIRLVNNLIDITKLDSGYFELNYRNRNIVEIVEDITLSVSKFVEDNDLTLTFDTDTEEKIMACDSDKIERILLNLLSNSIKFTPSGGSIYVNIYDKTDFIIISIKDTGIGIDKDKQDIIFQRFRQVDKSLTRKSEGSGIGLSIAKSLVEIMEGELTVNSEVNKGSEFIIKLPAKVIEDTVSEGYEEIACTSENTTENIQIEFSDIYSK